MIPTMFLWQIKVDDSETPLSAADGQLKVDVSKLPAKNKVVTLDKAFADEIFEKILSSTTTVVLRAEQTAKKGITIKLSQGFLKKMAASYTENLVVNAGNWHITLDKKKVKSLSASSKNITFTMKEVKADKNLAGKKYKAKGTAFTLEVKRIAVKDGKKHNIIIPVTAKYSSYKKNLVILRKLGKKSFKYVEKIKVDKKAKEITAMLNSAKQTLVLALLR